METKKIDIEKLKSWAEDNICHVLTSLDVEYIDKGRYLQGCCPVPYHMGDANNRTAFTWSFNKNRWWCFTHACQDHTRSDIFGLVMAVKECSFGASLYELLKFQALPSSTTPVKRLNKTTNNVNFKINQIKLQHLHKDVYFKNRGIDPKILEKHKVGYWQKEGTYMDKRAIVPIFDELDNLVGFTGRSLLSQEECDKQGISKWIHGADYINFNRTTFYKSLVLYNLNNAKRSIEATRKVYIVEGPIDLWHLQMAGIENVVATLGLGVSPAQWQLLVNSNIEEIIICYDNDKHGAGEKAANAIKSIYDSLVKITIKIPTKKDFGETSIEEIRKQLCI